MPLEQLEKLEEKTFPFEVKALTEEGQFEGYAAIFDKPDLYRDIIMKGAFTKTLREKKNFPLLWYHDPRNPVGLTSAETDSKGLKVLGQLNLDVQAAKEKYALMKQKAIRGLSIGYRTIIDIWDTKKKVRYLKEIKLYEISLATFQIHPRALVTAVKSQGSKTLDDALRSVELDMELFQEFKAGKMISGKNMKILKSALLAIDALIKAAEPSDDTQAAKKSFMIPEDLGNLGTGGEPRATHSFLDQIVIPKN